MDRAIPPGIKQESVAAPDFFDWRSQLHSFEALLGYIDNDDNVVTGDDAFQVHTVAVTGIFGRSPEPILPSGLGWRASPAG